MIDEEISKALIKHRTSFDREKLKLPIECVVNLSRSKSFINSER